MKGIFRDASRGASLFSLREAGQQECHSASPRDDKMTAPDCDGCSLTLRAAAGQGPRKNLPFVAWKWKPGLALCSSAVWRTEQMQMKAKSSSHFSSVPSTGRGPWSAWADQDGCHHLCVTAVVTTAFTMTSNSNHQHTSQIHKAQGTQTQAWHGKPPSCCLTASTKCFDVLGHFLV